MDIIIDSFETLKLSALNKVKIVNKDIHEVTIGPNQTTRENKSVTNNTKATTKPKTSSIITSRRFKDDRISIGKVLAEAEAQRRNEVQSSIEARLAILNAASKRIDSNSKNEWLKRQQLLIEKTRTQEDIMLRILEEHEKKACDLSEKLQLEYQKQQDERHRRNLELQKLEKQKQELRALIETIHLQQINFRTTYQEIVAVLKASNNKFVQTILASNPTMRTLPEAMDKIKEKCKIAKATNDDLNLSMSLVQEVKKLKDLIVLELGKLNEQERIEKKRIENEQEQMKTEQERIRIARQQQRIVESATIPTTVEQKIPQTATKTQVSGDVTFVSKDNLRLYAELQQFLDNYEASFQQFVNDPALKRFKFACQKAVNIPLNAISATSSQHLQDKYQRLSNLLYGKNVESGESVVNASQHPQGISFCTNLLAKKFVLQGDLIVSSKPEAAFYIAAVLVALWTDFPDFGKLVLAHFHREMPYLIPMYPIMLEGHSDKDYYMSLGYHYNDGVIEKHDKFLKRMTGMMRLYSAVTITKLKKSHHDRKHPHGVGYGWRWLAGMLNLEPRVDITATVMHEFFEVCGSTMMHMYGKQFRKLLDYLTNEYLPLIQKIDSGGPVTRLEVFLQKVKTSGVIQPPKGKLPEGFW